MRTEKLLRMINLLLAHSKLSAAVIAERLNVSVRTVYRYVDTLSTAGFPIIASKGHNGGIALLPEFKLNQTLVNSKEQVNILAALQTLSTLNVDDGTTVDKLAGLFKRTPVDWIEIDPTTWDNRPEQREQIQQLRQAILQQRFVRFDYLNARNQQAHRWVFPYQLVFKDHAWYLSGYAVERHAARIFKLSRIMDLTLAMAPDDATQPWLQKNHVQNSAPEKTLTARLWIAAAFKYRVVEDFSAERIETQADGSFIVETAYRDLEWLTTYLLSFGAGLKVIGPSELKVRVHQEIIKMLANYQ